MINSSTLYQIANDNWQSIGHRKVGICLQQYGKFQVLYTDNNFSFVFVSKLNFCVKFQRNFFGANFLHF